MYNKQEIYTKNLGCLETPTDKIFFLIKVLRTQIALKEEWERRDGKCAWRLKNNGNLSAVNASCLSGK